MSHPLPPKRDGAIPRTGQTAAAKTWRCTLSIAGGEKRTYEDLPRYNGGSFRSLGEIRIFSPGEEESMFHIDNFEYSKR